MLSRRLFLASLAVTPFAAGPAMAASPEVFAIDGVAMRGADPVAYFTQGALVMGTADHALMWKGATWWFATAEHMAQFEANPDAYAPQYGGYCAYAASQGAIATSVPEAWTVYEGKLYLNYSLNVRKIWSEDIPANIALADGFWPEILTR